MSHVEMLLLAFGVAIDALSVSVTGSLVDHLHPLKNALKAALVFGIFQAVMPLAGGLAGESFGALVEQFDHYIAAGLLAFVGGKMIYESFAGGDEAKVSSPFALKSLLVLGFATSIDAAAVGASVTLANYGIVEVLLPLSLLMAAATAIFSFCGVMLGRYLGKLGSRMEIVGGLVLIGIGIKIFCDHML